jgi:hypothetical protein
MAINNTLGSLRGLLPVQNSNQVPAQNPILTGGSNVATPEQMAKIKSFSPAQPVQSTTQQLQGQLNQAKAALGGVQNQYNAQNPQTSQGVNQIAGNQNTGTSLPPNTPMTAGTGSAFDQSGAPSGEAGQAYLDRLQNIKNNQTFDPVTQTYKPTTQVQVFDPATQSYRTQEQGPTPPLTTAGLVPGLLNASNNPTIAGIIQQEQKQMGDTLTGQPGQPLQLAQGRAGLIQNTAQAAIANALQEQQLQQGAIGTALGAVAPITGVPYGTQTLQPGLVGLGGNTGGANTGGETGGSLNPLNNISSIAQQVINHQISPQQGYSLGGNVPNFQGALNAEIQKQKPGFNTATAQGQYEAQQSNVTTSGTAQKQAAAAGYQGAVQERANAEASYGALTGIASQLTGTLENWGNSGRLTDYNKAINTLASLTSDPNYQAYIVALGNTQAAYQKILGSTGVTPTKADTDAMNALNPNSSASAIVSAINQLSKDAHALVVEPSYKKVKEYEKQLGI